MQNENSEFPFVSFVVPCRNEVDYIGDCVSSILNLDYPRDRVEVLVVDGMSTDGTDGVVRQLQATDDRVRLVPNPKKIVSPAMNLGIQNAQGELVCIVGGHATVERDFLKEATRILNTHLEVWCVGGPIRTTSKTYMGQAIAAAMSSPIGIGNAKFRLGGGYEGYADTVPFPVYRKSTFEKTGLFDEALPRNQDDEMSFRVHLNGGKIYLNPRIRATYYARGTLGKLWRQYFQYGFWTARTIQKHGRPASIRKIIPVGFVSTLLALAVVGLLWRPAWCALGLLVGLYALGVFAGFAHVCSKAGVKYAFPAPLIFMALHFGYGFGTLWGIVRFGLLKGRGIATAEIKMTR
jgi:cellulose synthase/poly-beta-1,6-N-acetylglucosamine synthase-like glycosyltransferase